MQQETEKELARLLQGYFSKETAVEILGTTPDQINIDCPGMERRIGGVALYPVGAVAQKILENRGEELKAGKPLGKFAKALAEKFSAS